jgi:hypothetical protein
MVQAADAHEGYNAYASVAGTHTFIPISLYIPIYTYIPTFISCHTCELPYALCPISYAAMCLITYLLPTTYHTVAKTKAAALSKEGGDRQQRAASAELLLEVYTIHNYITILLYTLYTLYTTILLYRLYTYYYLHYMHYIHYIH